MNTHIIKRTFSEYSGAEGNQYGVLRNEQDISSSEVPLAQRSDKVKKHKAGFCCAVRRKRITRGG